MTRSSDELFHRSAVPARTPGQARRSALRARRDRRPDLAAAGRPASRHTHGRCRCDGDGDPPASAAAAGSLPARTGRSTTRRTPRSCPASACGAKAIPRAGTTRSPRPTTGWAARTSCTARHTGAHPSTIAASRCWPPCTTAGTTTTPSGTASRWCSATATERSSSGFTSSLSVIGHELTHGVTQFTAALDYEGQSGALNESVSDVFGALVEQFARGQDAADASWLIGAGLFTDQVQGVALRSMKAPGTAYDDDVLGKDPQPADMSGYVTTAGRQRRRPSQLRHSQSRLLPRRDRPRRQGLGARRADLVRHADRRYAPRTMRFRPLREGDDGCRNPALRPGFRRAGRGRRRLASGWSDSMKVTVVRSGGIAGLTRNWEVVVDEQDDMDSWIELIESLPWRSTPRARPHAGRIQLPDNLLTPPDNPARAAAHRKLARARRPSPAGGRLSQAAG